ncbi:unnamed protein product [Anisakis simplex]|uniref:RNA methyltransferase n=1 Tax=Anisakis simplex TaxID=6269 RepID=A0A0M3K1W6_ANISI|nr:unnamed protein product [Anisakis simplex]
MSESEKSSSAAQLRSSKESRRSGALVGSALVSATSNEAAAAATAATTLPSGTVTSSGGGSSRRRFTGDISSWSSAGSASKRRRFGDGDSRTAAGLEATSLPFLHGGNIKDPLNLKSVQPIDENEIMKPLEVIIPKNIHDPLNLRNITKNRNKRKRRNSKQGECLESPPPAPHSGPVGVGATEAEEHRRRSNTISSGSISSEHYQQHPTAHHHQQQQQQQRNNSNSSDPIVSPVPASVVRKFSFVTPQKKLSSEGGSTSTPAPSTTPQTTPTKPKADSSSIQQPQQQDVNESLSKDSNLDSQQGCSGGAPLVLPSSSNNDDISDNVTDSDNIQSKTVLHNSAAAAAAAAASNVDQKKKQKERFRYGNFNRYYGTRLESGMKRDPRIELMHKEWFEKKSVLDIGCNAGYITLTIAKDFEPRHIVGIDIDEHLVGVARKNIRHYCDYETQMSGSFPASFSRRYGPISLHSTKFSTKFPDNIWFKRENYVLENDECLEEIHEEFDVIMALSITKWVHLNWGDAGLKRFFRRAFKELHPGGRFILEPQAFDSYRKRAKLTPEVLENYKNIKLLPDAFHQYLLNEIGFESCQVLDLPKAKSKGFQRPIYVYRKKTSSKLNWKSRSNNNNKSKNEISATDCNNELLNTTED